MESHIGDIAHVIQLAVAPVFLLTGIAALISTLNARLGRIVDRRRAIQERPSDPAQPHGVESGMELHFLSRRIRIIYVAIFCAVVAALMVCLVVGGAFLGALLAIDLARAVAVIFIIAMFALIACLSLFLREIYLAVAGNAHYAR